MSTAPVGRPVGEPHDQLSDVINQLAKVSVLAILCAQTNQMFEILSLQHLGYRTENLGYNISLTCFIFFSRKDSPRLIFFTFDKKLTSGFISNTGVALTQGNFQFLLQITCFRVFLLMRIHSFSDTRSQTRRDDRFWKTKIKLSALWTRDNFKSKRLPDVIAGSAKSHFTTHYTVSTNKPSRYTANIESRVIKHDEIPLSTMKDIPGTL